MNSDKLRAAAVSQEPAYIEDVFSTYLYTGTGSTQTITNGIDLAGEGGLVWLKVRSSSNNHLLFDTARGSQRPLYTNSTVAQQFNSNFAAAMFNSNGFNLGTAADNDPGLTYASWTFRKAEKFFDVVTYTGDGVNGRQIPHNLGSTPGCVIVKCTNDATRWAAWHRSLTPGYMLTVDLTNAEFLISGSSGGGVSTADASTFTVATGSSLNWVNGFGKTYVAYLFAHDAGGFGEDGSENVISCGSFTTNGSVATTVNLGYEPQWVLVKQSDAAGSWVLVDNMRGMNADTTGNNQFLTANTSNAEASTSGWANPTSTGFTNFRPAGTYIYIAIRRGPMKVPESGTEVYQPVTYTGTGSNGQVITASGLSYIDTAWCLRRTGGDWFAFGDRLRGSGYLIPQLTAAEDSGNTFNFAVQSAFIVNTASSSVNANTQTYVLEAFRRAPGFFDVVCYTGTGSAMTVAHGLGVTPEMMIVKRRSGIDAWLVYHAALGATKIISLNDYQPAVTSTIWNNTAPTSSVFSGGVDSAISGAGETYVAYLFATVAGVSKVGSYTGTGTTLQINCGFSSGARFVLIKRTDGSGDSADGWYVWDSARGIVAGNDPYLLLNSTAAEVTSTDYVDTYSAGFEISSTAPAAINASGGSFIFLAIA